MNYRTGTNITQTIKIWPCGILNSYRETLGDFLTYTWKIVLESSQHFFPIYLTKKSFGFWKDIGCFRRLFSRQTAQYTYILWAAGGDFHEPILFLYVSYVNKTQGLTLSRWDSPIFLCVWTDLPTDCKASKKKQSSFLLFFGVNVKAFKRLKDISIPDFLTPSFNPGPFNLRLFNHELFNPIIQKLMVEKSGVEKFMVEKPGVERSGVEAWGWKVRGWDVLHFELVINV